MSLVQHKGFSSSLNLTFEDVSTIELCKYYFYDHKRNCIQSVITAFSVKAKRTSNVYVSSVQISLVMVSPFALAFIIFN